jgi:hypothetical protein
MALKAVRDYWNRPQAEHDVQRLLASGIEAFLASDDAGGLRPEVGFMAGFRVIVREEDLAEAEAVLGGQEEPE